MMRVVLICINMRKMHMSSSGVEYSMPRSTFLQLRILLRKGTSTGGRSRGILIPEYTAK